MLFILSFQITAVSSGLVEAYLQIFQLKISDKCMTMYKERFLHSVRFCLHENQTFIKARVSAEMKKSRIYVVDIQLDLNNGIIFQESLDHKIFF